MTEEQIPYAAPEPSSPRPFRQRVLGMRGVAAVAVASVILGGAGGVALNTAVGSEDSGGRGGPGGGPMMGGFSQRGSHGFSPSRGGGTTPPGAMGSQGSSGQGSGETTNS